MHLNNNLLRRINKEGFVFAEYDPSLIEHLQNPEDIAFILKEWVKEQLPLEGETLYVDWEALDKGEEIKLHYHIIPGSFQAVTWVPREEFEGREFIYGSPEMLKEVKPRIGLICFFKPNDPEFIHGVKPLLSNSRVESYGFTSSIKDISDTDNDIYV